MKHQLFKNKTYVEIDTGKSHLVVIGKVKNSTVVNRRIRAEDSFNMPQPAIELDMRILIIPENPEFESFLNDDTYFIEDMVKQFNGLSWKEGKLYASIFDLQIPGEEYKKVYYQLTQGTKQI